MGRVPTLDQQTLITFVAYMGLIMCYAHSTVRVILYLLRRACLENELSDPLSSSFVDAVLEGPEAHARGSKKEGRGLN